MANKQAPARKTVATTAVDGAKKDLEAKAKADSAAIQAKIDSAEKNGEVLGDPRDESLAGPTGENEQAAQLLASQAPAGTVALTGRRKIAAAEMVDVQPTTKRFKLTGDDGIETEYEVGTTKMPRAHAEHWYAEAHGVVLK